MPAEFFFFNYIHTITQHINLAYLIFLETPSIPFLIIYISLVWLDYFWTSRGPKLGKFVRELLSSDSILLAIVSIWWLILRTAASMVEPFVCIFLTWSINSSSEWNTFLQVVQTICNCCYKNTVYVLCQHTFYCENRNTLLTFIFTCFFCCNFLPIVDDQQDRKLRRYLCNSCGELHVEFQCGNWAQFFCWFRSCIEITYFFLIIEFLLNQVPWVVH